MTGTIASRLTAAAGALAAPAAVLLLATGAHGDGAGARAKAEGAIAASREAVPILMYHQIRTAPAGARLPSLYVRPRAFAEHVRALQGAGYRAVTLQRAWDAWQGSAALPRRPIVISFDDGYASQAAVALPVMRRARWPGVLNLALDWVDDLGGDGAVRRLLAAGWEIDAHSRTHADLTRAPTDQLVDETAGARAELQRRFGIAANFFCYPSGRYDARVVAAVREAGFLAATTVKRGFADPAAPFALARVQVGRGMSGGALLRRLRALRARAAR